MTLVRERPEPRRRKFTYRELVAMEKAPDGDVELWRGNLIAMTPANPPPALVVDEFHERFVEVLGTRARVRSRHPLRA